MPSIGNILNDLYIFPEFRQGLFRNDKKDEAHIDICSSDTLRVIIKYFYTGKKYAISIY